MSEVKKTIWPNRPSMDDWQFYCSRHGGAVLCEALLPQMPEGTPERERWRIHTLQYHKREELITEDKFSCPEATAEYEAEAVYDSLMDQDEYYFSQLYWEMQARGLFPNAPSEKYAHLSNKDLLDLWEKKEKGEI